MRKIAAFALALVLGFVSSPADARPAREAKVAARGPAEAVPQEVVSSQFSDFCKDWASKLATRERDNRAAIRWQPSPSGVKGEFVGYSPQPRCELKDLPDPKAVPIGRIIYREITYQQNGSSASAAATSQPDIVDQTEVTEIFRYSKGQWVY